MVIKCFCKCLCYWCCFPSNAPFFSPEVGIFEVCSLWLIEKHSLLELSNVSEWDFGVEMRAMLLPCRGYLFRLFTSFAPVVRRLGSEVLWTCGACRLQLCLLLPNLFPCRFLPLCGAAAGSELVLRAHKWPTRRPACFFFFAILCSDKVQELVCFFFFPFRRKIAKIRILSQPCTRGNCAQCLLHKHRNNFK